MLILHPDAGAMLYDTGYADRFEQATTPFPERFYRWLTPVTLPVEQHLGTQLRRYGVRLDEVKRVIISHMHADHVAGLRNLWVAPFYDVGEIYVNGHSIDGVAHALGVGLRADVALFSFIERTVVRFDAAKTVNAASPWQFWLGMEHAF